MDSIATVLARRPRIAVAAIASTSTPSTRRPLGVASIHGSTFPQARRRAFIGMRTPQDNGQTPFGNPGGVPITGAGATGLKAIFELCWRRRPLRSGPVREEFIKIA